jgi:poly-gamma-glutamate synthesis protein (capsule biosynthesis protein)
VHFHNIRRARLFIFLRLGTLFLIGLSACRAAEVVYVPSAVGVGGDPQKNIEASAALPPTATPFQPSSPTPVWTPTPAFTPPPPPTSTPLPQTTLLFTGVIVPARCVQAGIDARGSADYIFDEVREIIGGADLAIGTLNATMSDYPPHTGCIFTYVLVGGSSNADALQRAGFDGMSVATNHIKNCGIGDCGDRAFFDTLDNLNRVGIKPIGAGMSLDEAIQPVVFTVNGVRFGFVSLGQIEPMTFAGEDTPGIAVLNDDNLRQSIQAARQASDVVIAMPHWGPEDSPNPNEYQLHFAQVAVEAGADLVMGNHTHVVQAIQEIDSVPVFYGLGNFVFDQTWDLAHQQGVILKVTFQGTQYIGYELIPTHVDGDGTVHIAGSDEAAQILQRIQAASDQLK